VIKDDAVEIAEKVKNADTLVFATPIYYYEMSGQMKTLLDRLISTEPLSIQMSMYGGFEQVGSIGTSLPRNDVQITTESGDIVLYSGNQIVVFYGSNSWSYTRLGRITDKNVDELAEILGNEDVTITIDSE
jgi:putative NADPH-quinone reductase